VTYQGIVVGDGDCFHGFLRQRHRTMTP
jgi:hypothetical protein